MRTLLDPQLSSSAFPYSLQAGSGGKYFDWLIELQNLNTEISMNKLSIITVVLNNLNGIKSTADSLIRQKSSNFEWIVVDGLSSDGTVEYVKKLEICSTIISEKDNGLYDAMNKGMKLVKGDYVLFLNAGDILKDSRVVYDINTWEITQDIVLCNSAYKYNTGVSVIRKARPICSVWHSIPSNHQAILFKASVLRGIKYRENFKICADYALVAELFMLGVSSVIKDRTISEFEMGGLSTIKINGVLKEALAIQRNILKLKLFICFFSYIRRSGAMMINYLLWRINCSRGK